MVGGIKLKEKSLSTKYVIIGEIGWACFKGYKVNTSWDICAGSKQTTIYFQVHKDKPFSVKVGDEVHSVDYNSGESRSDMFGGNSNWRGPVWFPSRFQWFGWHKGFWQHL